MAYIYNSQGRNVLSGFGSGHIVDHKTPPGYVALCGLEFSYIGPDFTLRDKAQPGPGVSLCKVCQKIRKSRNRKKPEPVSKTEADLVAWNS